MTIIAGYIDIDTLANSNPGSRYLECDPKAGLFLNCGVTGAEANMDTFNGLDPAGDGVSSISFGVIDSAGNALDAVECSIRSSSLEESRSAVDTGGIIATPLAPPTVSGGPLVDFVSFDSGWMLKRTGTVPDVRSFFLALEGDNMVSQAGTFSLPAVGTTVTVNGFGFDPDLVLVFGAANGTNGGIFCLGALDAAGNQWACATVVPNIESGAPYQKCQSKSAVLLLAPNVTGFTGSTGHEATGAMVSGGFQITQTTPPAANMTYGYLAIHDPDGEFKVGFGSMSAGASGLAAAPEAALFATVFETDESSHNDGYMSVGYQALETYGPEADATPAAGVFTVNKQTSGASHGGQRRRTNTSAHSLILTDSVAGTTTDTFDATLTSDGFTTSASTSSYKYGWVTLRGSDQAGCGAAFVFVPQVYRHGPSSI